MTESTLPKYIHNANRIIETLAQQPDKMWSKTQRELGEQLGFSQPELSTLLKLLLDHEKIIRGAALPGVRGKNYVIELVDETPFTHSVSRRRSSAKNASSSDRALAPGEEVQGVINLGDLTMDKIGLAVMRALQAAWAKEDRHVEIRSEQMQRLRDFREQLSDERRLRSQLVSDKEALQRQVHELEHTQNQLRAEVNALLLKARGNAGSYQLRDIVDDDSLRTLEMLMKGKPGQYRESDRELGINDGEVAVA